MKQNKTKVIFFLNKNQNKKSKIIINKWYHYVIKNPQINLDQLV